MANNLYVECQMLVERLHKLKEEKNLTYQQIGTAVGVNRSHIYRIFNNLESSPSLDVLVKMAKFFEVPLYSLFAPSESAINED